MSNERVLQNTWNSSCSWRVRMVMAYKKLDYKYETVNLVRSEDANPVYINQNPSGVPTLTEANGQQLTQSMAIMEYLEEVYPENSVLPKDAQQRALCRALALEVVSGIQPLQNMGVAYLHILCRGSWPKEKPNIMIGAKQVGAIGEVTNIKYLKDVLIEKLWGVENLMSRVAGTYSIGDTFTIADAALIPQVHASHHSFGVDISVYPTIARVMKTLRELDFVKSTEPDNCPDFVPGGNVPLSVVAVPKE
jgi:maleylacetoacetate isomerase